MVVIWQLRGGSSSTITGSTFLLPAAVLCKTNSFNNGIPFPSNWQSIVNNGLSFFIFLFFSHFSFSSSFLQLHIYSEFFKLLLGNSIRDALNWSCTILSGSLSSAPHWVSVNLAPALYHTQLALHWHSNFWYCFSLKATSVRDTLTVCRPALALK